MLVRKRSSQAYGFFCEKVAYFGTLLCVLLLSRSGSANQSYERMVFFDESQHVAMLTYGTGLSRQLLSLFLQETYAGTQRNTLYSGSYFLKGHMGMLPLRHRFEFGYQGNTLSAYKDYRHFFAGWLPEFLFGLDPIYFAVGIGPYLKFRKTPVSGGLFFVAFNMACGVSFERCNLEIFLRHHSNAYTSSPNHGSDFIGLGFSYCF